MEANWLTLLIVTAVTSSAISAMMAHDKNRSVLAWAVIGLICNLPTLAVLARLKPLERDKPQ